MQHDPLLRGSLGRVLSASVLSATVLLATVLSATVLSTSMLLVGAPLALGAAGKAKLRVTGAWVRPTPPGAPTAAVYALIENGGAVADRIVALETDAAEAAELHSMKMDGGMMVMRPVEGGLIVPAHGTLAFKPRGYHIMLIHPKRRIMPGDTVAVTIVFEKAGRITLAIPAGPPEQDQGAGMAGHAHGGNPQGQQQTMPHGEMPHGQESMPHPPAAHRKP